MIKQQQSLILSPYIAIYDIVVPKDNLLRQIKTLVDFSFIYDELLDKYCLDNGRSAIDPLRMFKYLLLKSVFSLSDMDVVDRSVYDMSFKFFLDMAPEENVIDASSLTKFRKQRLKDMNLLDMLLAKTVEIALEKGIITSSSIIVDATHTYSRYNKKSPRESLMEQSTRLRKTIYEINPQMEGKFPPKNTEDDLKKEIEYCQELITFVENTIPEYPAVKEKLNFLKEMVDDDIEYIKVSEDEDAKTGHKTADSSFFGYKTHIAMSEERIITAAAITTGEKDDGKQLETLITKSIQAGMNVETVIGDAAYSGKENIKYTDKHNIKLVAKLSSSVTHGNRKNEDKFEFNKDAEMYVCKAGHLATKKVKQGKKNVGRNQSITYYFDVEKCKVCPLKEGCYKEGNKSKTYAVRIMSAEHTEQAKFQESDYFKEKSKERYKIEAKNSELKNRHGYDVASSSGLVGMQIQGAMAMFAVNLKRILKLER